MRTPQWPELEATTRDRLEKAAVRLGEKDAEVDEVSLPDKFSGLVEAQSTILEVELSCALSYEFENYPDRLSKVLCGVIEQGRSVGMDKYFEARKLAAECRW